MSRCVILSAAPVENAELLRAYLREDDCFIAADGGLRLAERLHVTPHLLVADFDSFPEENVRLDASAEVIKLPVEKDWTDTMAAAMLGLEKGYTEFLILGGIGGRLDHTIANMAVLLYLLKHGAVCWMADERNRLRLYLPGQYTIPVSKGFKFSLFPYGDKVEGITVKNAQYPLENACLTSDVPLGVSNEFLEKPVEISFNDGILMFFLAKD